MLVSSAVFAGGLTDTGFIKSINPKAHSIYLADGHTFVLPSKFNFKSIKVGEKVMISYKIVKKSMLATAVKAV